MTRLLKTKRAARHNFLSLSSDALGNILRNSLVPFGLESVLISPGIYFTFNFYNIQNLLDSLLDTWCNGPWKYFPILLTSLRWNGCVKKSWHFISENVAFNTTFEIYSKWPSQIWFTSEVVHILYFIVLQCNKCVTFFSPSRIWLHQKWC